MEYQNWQIFTEGHFRLFVYINPPLVLRLDNDDTVSTMYLQC